MKKLAVLLIAVTVTAAAAKTVSTVIPPWSFGMTPAEVSGFTNFGPYKTFSNGDLETFNGIYDGKKQNIQFFFDGKGVWRISVCLYEGNDKEAARKAWVDAYESLAKKYGKIEIPGIEIKAGSDPVNTEVMSIAVSANTIATGKTQMAPVKQPGNALVFSSFISGEVKGIRLFVVNINYDRK